MMAAAPERLEPFRRRSEDQFHVRERREKMGKDPLSTINDLDPELFDLVSRNRQFAFKEGKLSVKVKYLIALALDAAHGAENGVRALSQQAIRHGASKEEIMEALHVANFVSGVGSVYTAAAGLKDVSQLR
jgi:alkylhydroperoxidase/carboxymuconolactone decarboxylase family protein YurZ